MTGWRRAGLNGIALHERQFLPRVILGEYYRDRFLYLVERARDVGFVISVCESCEVTDIAVQPTGIAIHTDKCSRPGNCRPGGDCHRPSVGLKKSAPADSTSPARGPA